MRKLPPSLCLGAALLGVICSSAPAQQRLTTLFNHNNGGGNGWGVFFDLNVTAPGGVSIIAFESNLSVTTPFTLDFYTCPQTHVGNDGNATPWTLQRTGKGLAMGPNGRALSTFAQPVRLAAGSYGIALYANNFTGTYHYTDGTGSNQVYSNADLTISCGLSRSGLFTGTQFSPRVWNGTIYYDTAVNPPAFLTWAAAGCTGSGGTPTMAAATGSAPKLGTSFQVAFTSLPATPGALAVMIGVSRDSFGALALPLSLAAINMPGCNLYTSIELTVSGVNLGGTGLAGIAIPSDVALLGGEVFLQTFVPDPAASGFQARVTNAAQIVFGL